MEKTIYSATAEVTDFYLLCFINYSAALFGLKETTGNLKHEKMPFVVQQAKDLIFLGFPEYSDPG